MEPGVSGQMWQVAVWIAITRGLLEFLSNYISDMFLLSVELTSYSNAHIEAKHGKYWNRANDQTLPRTNFWISESFVCLTHLINYIGLLLGDQVISPVHRPWGTQNRHSSLCLIEQTKLVVHTSIVLKSTCNTFPTFFLFFCFRNRLILSCNLATLKDILASLWLRNKLFLSEILFAH